MTVFSRRSLRRLLACLVPLGALLAPAGALANSQVSTNWAGYVANRSGVHFKSVSARWRVPAVSCSQAGASAAWVGLGGFSETTTALEQTGTEQDCTSAGHSSYYAWYEIVPAASREISLAVKPGDLMSAQVSVAGHRVTMTLRNLTTHHAFTKTITAASVDTSSADWIVEAPSQCDNFGRCMALPLADFAGARFGSAQAVTRNGRRGGVASSFWGATEITLAAGNFRYISNGSSAPAAGAQPTTLSAADTAFAVDYETSSPAAGQYSAADAAIIRGGHLVHPLRTGRP